MRLQREREHRVMAWANGRGSTMEIATHPSPDAWVWRLSLADVPEDGPFSSLPGVDRCLAVASGVGMRLFVDGVETVVRTRESVAFAGDATTLAVLLDGPVRDLNLMVRRGDEPRAPHLDLRRLAAGDDVRLDGALALVVLHGELALPGRDGDVIRPFDAVFPDDGDGGSDLLHVSVDAWVALAFLRTRSGSGGSRRGPGSPTG